MHGDNGLKHLRFWNGGSKTMFDPLIHGHSVGNILIQNLFTILSNAPDIMKLASIYIAQTLCSGDTLLRGVPSAWRLASARAKK
jgi:hypothetical protein